MPHEPVARTQLIWLRGTVGAGEQAQSPCCWEAHNCSKIFRRLQIPRPVHMAGIHTGRAAARASHTKSGHRREQCGIAEEEMGMTWDSRSTLWHLV